MLERVERHSGWVLVVIVLAMLAIAAWSIIQHWQNSITLRAGTATFSVELADTPKERAKGLGGRSKLDVKQGMLFVYNDDKRWGIWMKDMQIPIDIVWLNKEKHIVHMTKNVTPDTYPEVFHPSADARYVIEFAAGTVEAEKFSLGQLVHFDLPAQ